MLILLISHAKHLQVVILLQHVCSLQAVPTVSQSGNSCNSRRTTFVNLPSLFPGQETRENVLHAFGEVSRKGPRARLANNMNLSLLFPDLVVAHAVFFSKKANR